MSAGTTSTMVTVRRFVVAIAFLVVVLGGLAGVKRRQLAALALADGAAATMDAPPEVVGTAAAREETWEDTLTAVGTVATTNGVAVSTDVPGIVERVLFGSGARVRRGQVMAVLDASVERAQLASARARYTLAQRTLARSRALASSGSISQAQIDTDDAALQTAATELAAVTAQIDRKTLRAPFSGRVGLLRVNVGQFLAAGTPVATLETSGAVHVDFELPQQRIPDVAVGTPVRFALDGGAVLEGAVDAIEPQVDALTRTAKARATIPDQGERLRDGMYGTVTLVLSRKLTVVAVPTTAILHAPYGDSVFLAEDATSDAGVPLVGSDGKRYKVARQQFIRAGAARGDLVAMVSGVKKDENVVVAGAFKLRNGAPIAVDNSVIAPASAQPAVENH